MGDQIFECDFDYVDSGIFQLFPNNSASLPLPSIPALPSSFGLSQSPDGSLYSSFGLECLLTHGAEKSYHTRLEDERLESYSDFHLNGTTYELDDYDYIQQKIRGQDPPTREIPVVPNERIKEYLWHKQCKQSGQVTLSKNFKKSKMICVFCKNNKEPQSVYTGHTLKDGRGYTVCPVLRKYPCPICSAIGDHAHTIKYCPLNNDSEYKTSPSPLRTSRMATGKKRH